MHSLMHCSVLRATRLVVVRIMILPSSLIGQRGSARECLPVPREALPELLKSSLQQGKRAAGLIPADGGDQPRRSLFPLRAAIWRTSPCRASDDITRAAASGVTN